VPWDENSLGLSTDQIQAAPDSLRMTRKKSFLLKAGLYKTNSLLFGLMHENPRFGVVDPDGRVHGVDNLYVSGAPVFPSSGFANPTLTIVALALRLADHLNWRV
jgi:GMC oxidoreductase